MHAQACVCAPLFTFAPGTFMCDCEWPARDSEDIREGSAPQASLSHLPHLCLVVWQRQCMSAPDSSLSSGFLLCCSWASLGYFFLCSCNSDLCLEVPWCLECCQWVLGTGRHTMYFTKSQTLLTFGYYVSSVNKTEGKEDNAYKFYYWASRLLRPKSMICGAGWRTLSTASHIKNIIWVKFEAYLLASWMPAAAMYILQYVCCSFQSVLKYGKKNSLTHCFVPEMAGMWTDSFTDVCDHACVPRSSQHLVSSLASMCKVADYMAGWLSYG